MRRPIQQADSLAQSVTSLRSRARERKRLQRARARAPLVYERDDWQLFLDPATLPQKAGCQPADLPALVLKELVDNALDAGGDNVTLTKSADGALWIVADDGPGLDPDQVADLFAVNRPLRSSKLKRLPTRGMLGNGLRVVTAWARTLTVETRGVRQTLTVDAATGRTVMTHSEPIAERPGLIVSVPVTDNAKADGLARLTLAVAECGSVYSGPSLPQWYGPSDMARLMQAAPARTMAANVIRDLGLTPPDGLCKVLAHDLDSAATIDLLRALQRQTKPIKPDAIGKLGNVYGDCTGYAAKAGVVIEPEGGHVPFMIEASAACTLPETKGNGSVRYGLMINRSATVAPLFGRSHPDYLSIDGCGLDMALRVPTGDYRVLLSLIAPHVVLTSDGKAPSLSAYENAIEAVVYKAARQAHARVSRPERQMSIKAAAWAVMPSAYMVASADGTLPANARQIMYAARPEVLRLTGKDRDPDYHFNDDYFTQVLLPGFMAANPELTADWDVVFDDRGTFIEPHTGRVVPLGTIAVREYLGERLPPPKAVTIDPGWMATTAGPRHRYCNVLFVEKEGFGALLAHAQIAELFDLAIMSTKGMSNTAARHLIDGLMRAGVERIFVLHDLDVSGFSILGTLGTSSRRYRFDNPPQIIDLGLRLDDIRAMSLQTEPSPNRNDTTATWAKRAATLRQHGAIAREIAFLRQYRVELNAMPSDVFVQFLTDKLAAHGARKLVPGHDVLADHARDVLTRALLNRQLAESRQQIEADAAQVQLPADLVQQVEAIQQAEPTLPWDIAVAIIARRIIGDESDT
jgi:hypothetical protein